MGLHAFAFGHHLDDVVILARPARESTGFFEDFVRVFPIETRETHLFGKFRDDLPVRQRFPGCIAELAVNTNAALAVGAGEIFLAPGCRRQDDVREFGADRIAQIDVLIHQDHAARIRAFLQRVDDGLLVLRLDLVRIVVDQPFEMASQILRAAGRLYPGGPDDPREPCMAVRHPSIQIETVTAPAGHLVRRFPGRIFAAADATALVTAQAGHDLARLAADAENGAEIADRCGIEVVIGPVVALLDQDGGFDPFAVDGLGHHLRGFDDQFRVESGNLGRDVQLRFFLRQDPFFPILEALDLEMSPGRPPLPRRVPRALAESGIGLPEIGDPLLDEVLVFPTVLQDHPLNGHVYDRIRTRIDVQMQAAVPFRVDDAGRLARVDHDNFGLITVDPFQDPCIPHDRFGLIGIGPRDQQAIGLGEVLVGRAEDVVADIDPAGSGVDEGRMIVLRRSRRIDRL